METYWKKLKTFFNQAWKKLKKWKENREKKAHVEMQAEMPRWKRIGRKLMWLSIYGFLFGVLCLAAIIFWFNRGLPSAEDLLNANSESTQIFDREENLIYTVHGDENRIELAGIDQVSPYVIDATLAIEDDQFFDHHGLDYPAIFKAVMFKVFGFGDPRGGSTITQQLVKNAFLSPEQTITRKIKEAILAVKVEMRFTKAEILTFYFNTISYGGNAYGIETSSSLFFGKHAKDLDLAEAVIMASIPNSPNWYSPYGEHRYSRILIELTPEIVDDRDIEVVSDLEDADWEIGLIGAYVPLGNGQNLYLPGRTDVVLNRMLELGKITEAQKAQALSELQTIQFLETQEQITHPHFVFYVIEELEEMYGPEFVAQGGLKVYTTLDPTIQAAAEQTLTDYYESGFLAASGADNAAVVITNPKTGQILAMVGSVDFYNSEIDGQVNVVTSPRQPGSSFKPYVYAAMFLQGYGAGTVLYDIPTSFGGYKPNNYDDTFSGPITVRQAIGQSRNVPAIKAYYIAGGEEKLIPFIKSFGLDTLQENAGYGAPMALGTVNVTMLEMAEGYGVFANNGVRIPLSPFLKITNSDGDILYQWNEMDLESEQVLDPQAAYIINNILSDETVGFGSNTDVPALNLAVKTGTSSDGATGLPNDLWVMSYTPNIVMAMWVGNTDDSPLYYYATGYTTTGTLSTDLYYRILDQIEYADFPKPEGITSIAVSKTSGLLPISGAASMTDIFPSYGVPTEYDKYGFQTVQIETISNKLATPYSPAEFVVSKSYQSYHTQFAEEFPEWQAAIQAYYGTSGAGAPKEDASDIHNAGTAANAPAPSGISVSGDPVAGATVTVTVDTSTGNGLDKTQFSINGSTSMIASGVSGSIRIPVNATNGSTLSICAKVYDVYGYSGETCSSITVTGSESTPEPEAEPDPDAEPSTDPTTDPTTSERAVSQHRSKVFPSANQPELLVH